MNRASFRYLVRTSLFMLGYGAMNAAAIFGAFDGLQGNGRWALSLVAAAPVVGQIWATLSLMNDSDEYVRGLVAKRFVIAAGVAIAAFSAWGYLESFAEAPHAPGWFVYPLFWAAFALVTPFVRTTR